MQLEPKFEIKKFLQAYFLCYLRFLGCSNLTNLTKSELDSVISHLLDWLSRSHYIGSTILKGLPNGFLWVAGPFAQLPCYV